MLNTSPACLNVHSSPTRRSSDLDSTFSAAPTISLTAAITYPTNGAVNADLSHPIQWSSVANVQAYYLYVGTTAGAKIGRASCREKEKMYAAAELLMGQTV